MGHFITTEGVLADLAKIASMIKWPIPTNIKALRGFLGLRGYYRKFICHYGFIATPLTDLLRKNAFEWDDKTTKALLALNEAVTSPLVLKLPNFSQPFVIECDASGRVWGLS